MLSNHMSVESELLWVELKCKISVCFLWVFLPATQRFDLPSFTLNLKLSSLPAASSVILCGDFNAPGIDWDLVSPRISSRVSCLLCDIVLDASMRQLVQSPKTNTNILDLVLINAYDMVSSRWNSW